MDNTDKKLNQILNMLNLIHNENMTILEIFKSLCSEKDVLIFDKCIKDYNNSKEAIMSGIYEDDIGITHWKYGKRKWRKYIGM